MANQHSIEPNKLVLCVLWEDNMGTIEHIHYADEFIATSYKVMNRKDARKASSKAIRIEMLDTIEPCVHQTRAMQKLEGR